MTDKKTAKQAYLQNPPTAGVYLIKNQQTGKQLLSSAQNPQGTLERHRFELKFKQHRNKALQQDWDHYGEEAFTLEVLATINADEQNTKQALADLLTEWTMALGDNHEQYD